VNSQTAILIFARRTRAEAQRKWRLLSERAGTQLSTRLLERTIRTVQASGYDYILVDDSLQQGSTFGDRISHAIADVLSSYESTIVVGADCPGLTVESLHTAASRVRETGLVLGPDRRGGVYLIGLTRTTYSNIDWSSIQWQTKNVYRDLSAQHTCLTLGIQTDINNAGDISRSIYYKEISGPLASHLLSLTIAKRSILRHDSLVTHRRRIFYSLQRGPPAIAA
jgi:glycosyltransferase A (GT-A) superfamily protein (DUF2064 family)